MGADLRRSAAGLLAAATALATPIARGQAATAPVNLEWTAPEGCPRAGAVLSEIKGILRSSAREPN